jgi:hypothetical protein
MVKLVSELTVFLENRPGMLLELAEFLGRNAINILGIGLSEGGKDFGVCRLVVDKPTRAVPLLGSTTLMVLEQKVLALRLASKPGKLGVVTRALARGRINVEYAYGSCSPNGAHTLYMRVSEADRAVKILKKL